MRSQSVALIAVALLAAVLLAMAASPAEALCLPGAGCILGGGVPAPGPIAGAGLGYLVLAGGYYTLRRWRKQSPGE